MSEMPGHTAAAEAAEDRPEFTADVDHNEQSAGDKTEPADAPAADLNPDGAGTGS